MIAGLFHSRSVKEARLLAQHARKLLHRRKDLFSDVNLADLQSEIDRLEAAIRSRDELAIKETSEHLDAIFTKLNPPRRDASWRENCEVLLVAFVLAIGIRAYFLQPFKIPTGSMQPTLNGIIARPVPGAEPLPGVFVRFLSSLWLGRTYVDVVSEVDDQVVDVTSETRFFFMDYSRLRCASGRQYLVHAPAKTLTNAVTNDGFGVLPGHHYRAGDPIARGYVDTGDQVFVDKFTYNFRLPRAGDVFVFSTRNIAGISMEDARVKSEFYIKRLAGLPNDTLRIDSPRVFRNGELARAFGFERVMGAENGYRGYSNMPYFQYLRTPEDTFTVPPDSYFALGDNSYNSSDSRAWGVVPAGNVVGRGLFVYWPFTRHWGLVR